MNFWINLWTVFFFASLALFAALAVIVTIGGFFDIRSLFKGLLESRDESPQEPVDTPKKR
ncbi:MAG: hypothetical protein P8Z79_18905 [Sedimentisphaerales bacterium]|jgi:hypothetical protein